MRSSIPSATRTLYLSGDVTPTARLILRRLRLDFGATLYHNNDETVIDGVHYAGDDYYDVAGDLRIRWGDSDVNTASPYAKLRLVSPAAWTGGGSANLFASRSIAGDDDWSYAAITPSGIGPGTLGQYTTLGLFPMGGEENLTFTTLWSNSFDDGNVEFVEPGNSSRVSVTTSPKYAGAYGCLLSASAVYTAWWSRYLSSTRADLIIMARVKATDAAVTSKIYAYLDDGNHVSIRFDGQYWGAYVNDVKVTDGTVAVSTNWHHICVRFSIANAGSIQTWVDGIADIVYSGDTQPAASDQISYYKFFAAMGPLYCDSVVVGYGDYPGELVPEWKTVNADTAQADWTPSTGVDHYAVVDEVPASSADYLETSTDTHLEELELADWTLTDKTIQALVLKLMALKSTADSQQLAFGVASGGLTATGEVALNDLLTTVKGYTEVVTLDPNTSAAWIEAGVNAAHIFFQAEIP